MPAIIEAPGLLLAHRAAAAASLTLSFRGPKVLAPLRRRTIGGRLNRLQMLLDLRECILRNEWLRLILVVNRPLLEAALLGHKVFPVAILRLAVEIPLERLSLMETAAIHTVWLLHSRKSRILSLGG